MHFPLSKKLSINALSEKFKLLRTKYSLAIQPYRVAPDKMARLYFTRGCTYLYLGLHFVGATLNSYTW